MRVKIRKYDVEAIYEDGRWKCRDRNLLLGLQRTTEEALASELAMQYLPHQDIDIPLHIAKREGWEVVEVPTIPKAPDDGRVY